MQACEQREEGSRDGKDPLCRFTRLCVWGRSIMNQEESYHMRALTRCPKTGKQPLETILRKGGEDCKQKEEKSGRKIMGPASTILAWGRGSNQEGWYQLEIAKERINPWARVCRRLLPVRSHEKGMFLGLERLNDQKVKTKRGGSHPTVRWKVKQSRQRAIARKDKHDK